MEQRLFSSFPQESPPSPSAHLFNTDMTSMTRCCSNWFETYISRRRCRPFVSDLTHGHKDVRFPTCFQ